MAAEGLKVAAGVFFTLFVSFIIVGYQGLLPVLLKEGVFQDMCRYVIDQYLVHKSLISTRSNHTQISADEPLCKAQELHLSLMFTLGVSVLNGMCLPVGFIVQRYGPRITCSIGAILIASGSVLFAFSSSKFDAYIPGYILMGAGGPFVAFSMFSLAQIIPHRQGMIFSLIVAAFDGSSGLMFLFWVLNHFFHLSLRTMFLYYLVLPAALLLSTFWLFPPHSSPEKLQTDEYAQINPSTPLMQPTQWFKAHSSLRNIITSPPFILVVVWSMLYVTTKYFYMGNMYSEILWITSNDKLQARTAQFVFSIIVPLSALFAPLTSYLMDTHPPEVTVILMAITSLICAAAINIKLYYLQYATMTFIVFNRFAFFAIAPFLLTKMYGSEKGPTVLYGIDAFLASCFNYSNYLWTFLSVSVMNGSFFVLNLILNLLCAITGVLLALAIRRWRIPANSKIHV
jgi:MFS family permease